MRKINCCALGLFCLILFQVGLSQSAAKTEAEQLRENALKLYQEKQYGEAFKLAMQVVQIKEAELGSQHIEVARALYDATVIQIASGQVNEGEETLNKAVAIFELKKDLSADENIFGASLYETVGYVKFRYDEFEKSIAAYRRALALKEKYIGAESLEAAKTLWHLANVYLTKGDFKDASALYERVTKIRVDNLEKAGEDEAYDALRRYECTIKKGKDGNKQTKEFVVGMEAKISEYTKKTVVKGGIVNSKATYLAKPRYPEGPKANGVGTKVEVLITIDETGRVIFACAQSGDRYFHYVTEMAALNSRFSPTYVNGVAVKVSGIIVYKFIAR